MKVLIFGCDGFVGKYLSKEFKQNGYLVYGTGLLDLAKECQNHVEEYHKLDILDFNLVNTLIDSIRPDYIINLAAISSVGLSWSLPQKTIDVNVNGTLNILESVKQLNLKCKILLVGSSEEYAASPKMLNESSKIDAKNPYAISKMAQESFAEIYRDEYGLNVICTRTFNHSGIGQNDNFVIPSFVKQAALISNGLKEPTVSVGDLKIRRDFGDVRDMALAYRMILESDTKKTLFNVGSGNCYLLSELLSYILSLSNREVTITVDSAKIRPIDNPIVWCDNTLLKEETGWSPRYSIFDTINDMFEYYIGNLREVTK